MFPSKNLPVVVLRCSAHPVTQMKGCVAFSQPPLVHEHHIPSCFLQDCFCMGPISPCHTDFSLPLLKHHQQHANTLLSLAHISLSNYWPISLLPLQHSSRELSVLLVPNFSPPTVNKPTPIRLLHLSIPCSKPSN